MKKYITLIIVGVVVLLLCGGACSNYNGMVEKEQEERTAQAKERAHVEVNIPDSSEIVKKNLEASKNAGKR